MHEFLERIDCAFTRTPGKPCPVFQTSANEHFYGIKISYIIFLQYAKCFYSFFSHEVCADCRKSVEFMNLVSLESLKIFCDVVREKSFSRGAALNDLSQSAASQAVHQIEKRLGVRLIDRSKRPLGLTREGQIYYSECRDLVDRYLALEDRIRAHRDDAVARINVASIYSAVLYDMDRYVRRFQERRPGAQVRFQYLHPDDVIESVLSGQADLGLLSFPRKHRDIEIIPWRDEPMVLVCSPHHRFAALKQVTLHQLNGEAFVAFEAGLGIRRHIDQFLQRRGITVNITMAFDNIEFIKRGIETGRAISILPEPTVRNEVNRGMLRVVPVARLDLKRPMRIIRLRKRVVSPALTEFIKVLKENEKESVKTRELPARCLSERIKE